MVEDGGTEYVQYDSASCIRYVHTTTVSTYQHIPLLVGLIPYFRREGTKGFV